MNRIELEHDATAKLMLLAKAVGELPQDYRNALAPVLSDYINAQVLANEAQLRYVAHTTALQVDAGLYPTGFLADGVWTVNGCEPKPEDFEDA